MLILAGAVSPLIVSVRPEPVSGVIAFHKIAGRSLPRLITNPEEEVFVWKSLSANKTKIRVRELFY
jgi:hypothetical protein